jgi:hypothetical protein
MKRIVLAVATAVGFLAALLTITPDNVQAAARERLHLPVTEEEVRREVSELTSGEYELFRHSQCPDEPIDEDIARYYNFPTDFYLATVRSPTQLRNVTCQDWKNRGENRSFAPPVLVGDPIHDDVHVTANFDVRWGSPGAMACGHTAKTVEFLRRSRSSRQLRIVSIVENSTQAQPCPG